MILLTCACRRQRPIAGLYGSQADLVPVERPVALPGDAFARGDFTTALKTLAGLREAVDTFDRDRPPVILMDCQMPVMNGYEATAEIRRHPAGRDSFICGVSASTDAESRDRCRDSGMNDYLPKPVTLESLHDLLTRVAAHRVIAGTLRRDS